MRGLFLIPLLALSVTTVNAQRLGSSSRFSPRSSGRGLGSRAFFYPAGFFSDSDYPYSEVPAQPAIFLMQAPSAAAPTPPSLPGQPLLIELRGDRYVRISSEEVSGAQPFNQLSSHDTGSVGASGQEVSPSTAAKTNSAVLVFLDGHREETVGYTIVGGTLYAESDFYVEGSWNREVKLTDLNFPASVRENQLRGIRFRLPSAANEVVVGP